MQSQELGYCGALYERLCSDSLFSLMYLNLHWPSMSHSASSQMSRKIESTSEILLHKTLLDVRTMGLNAVCANVYLLRHFLRTRDSITGVTA